MKRFFPPTSLLLFITSNLVAQTIIGESPPHPELRLNSTRLHQELRAKKSLTEEGKPYTEKVKELPHGEIEMLPIPAGTFTMGSPASEVNRAEDEGETSPQPINVEAFWMAKTETTWALYQAFMVNQATGGSSRNKDGSLNSDHNIQTPDPIDPKLPLPDAITQPTPPYIPMHFGMGENSGYHHQYPAVGITQHAANKFCQWLSAKTGHYYRLPTEAEWEYACRAGTTTAYHFGNDSADLGDYAWFFENSESDTGTIGYQKVATKKPNPWGLYDMHGNVAEWTLDTYLPDAYTKVKEGTTNPLFLGKKRYPRSVRGGHWDADAEDLRSAARLASRPQWKMRDPQIPKSIWYFTDASWLGFRIVRPVKLPSAEVLHQLYNTGPGEL